MDDDKKNGDYGIVMAHGQARTMCVWPSHRAPPFGYCFTPHRGTLVQMELLTRQQFVETAPSRHYYSLDGDFPQSDFTPWPGSARF